MNFENNTPIYIQVTNDIKANIIKGNIKLGDKLPSARDLALKYKINPNTANRIYKELEMEEICYTKRGLGTFITDNTDMVNHIKDDMAKILTNNFFSGMIDLGFNKQELIELINKKYMN